MIIATIIYSFIKCLLYLISTNLVIIFIVIAKKFSTLCRAGYHHKTSHVLSQHISMNNQVSLFIYKGVLMYLIGGCSYFAILTFHQKTTATFDEVAWL